jgi:ribose transport system permease protein
MKEQKQNYKYENLAIGFFKDKGGILIALLIMCVAMSFASRYFLKINNIVNILRQVSTNAILALGMTYVILIGGIDLSIGSVQALAGMATSILIAQFGFPIAAAVFCGIVVGLVCGIFNGGIIAKTGMPPFIVTLAMMTIARGLAYMSSDGKPVRVVDEKFNLIGNLFIGPISMPIIYTMVIFIILLYVLNRTRIGRYIFAVGGNREAARYSGINTAKVEIICFSLSGLLAGFSGVVLTARMYTGQPALGNGAELDAIAAVVLGGTSFSGGVGTLSGTIIGAIVIGVISNGLNLLNMSSFSQMVVKGTVILIAVYLDTLKKRKQI